MKIFVKGEFKVTRIKGTDYAIIEYDEVDREKVIDSALEQEIKQSR